MYTKIKICGIRNITNAMTAIDAGADFIGFNFVSASVRSITPQKALKIISSIPRNISFVGIFRDAPLDIVNSIADSLNLDYIQLHGHENNSYIRKLDKPAIKAVTINTTDYPASAGYFLLDRSIQGEGNMVDMLFAKNLARKYPIFLAGGLTPDNVGKVVQYVKPYAVDVAGGIETKGQMDSEKIKLFIKNVKSQTI